MNVYLKPDRILGHLSVSESLIDARIRDVEQLIEAAFVQGSLTENGRKRLVRAALRMCNALRFGKAERL